MEKDAQNSDHYYSFLFVCLCVCKPVIVIKFEAKTFTNHNGKANNNNNYNGTIKKIVNFHHFVIIYFNVMYCVWLWKSLWFIFNCDLKTTSSTEIVTELKIFFLLLSRSLFHIGFYSFTFSRQGFFFFFFKQVNVCIFFLLWPNNNNAAVRIQM